jgi:fido (protein-threonine AMPylation protein)
VWIHSFPNGNGRHGRVITDLLLGNVLNQKIFTWGSGDLIKRGVDRQKYINALYAADNHDYKPLLEFVRL